MENLYWTSDIISSGSILKYFSGYQWNYDRSWGLQERSLGNGARVKEEGKRTCARVKQMWQGCPRGENERETLVLLFVCYKTSLRYTVYSREDDGFHCVSLLVNFKSSFDYKLQLNMNDLEISPIRITNFPRGLTNKNVI